jgi:hypothetical protein
MQGELSELDLQSVVLLKFLDTPGDEVAPGSNKIGKDFQYEWFGHDFLLINPVQGSKLKSFGPFKSFKTFKPFKSLMRCSEVGAQHAAPNSVQIRCSMIDSRVVGGGKSKGFWNFGAA